MVKAALVAWYFLFTGAALAQEGDSPPVVASEAPTLAQHMDAGTEAAPLLPGLTGMAPPAAEPAAVVAVETDLVSLVLKAHWVVQAVMALLALAVAAVLTVFLFKLVEISLAFARLRRANLGLAAGAGLVDLPGDCPLAMSARAARDEADALPTGLTPELRASARERLDLALDRIEARAVTQLRSGTGLLASIGAVGPFVGLFGTVFGIMNSFLAIAATKTTNLAVVAPGIAEALLATGIGLAAAIPAVLLYNAIMRQVAAFRHRLADGRAELLARFSRELDRRMIGAA
jgi:biopolymer transport protein ExbB